LGEELKKLLPIEVEYRAGSNGVFEISQDDTLIFSKAKAGRFPEPHEIAALIKNR